MSYTLKYTGQEIDDILDRANEGGALDAAIAAEKTRAEAAEALKAPIDSPVFTGTPTAPTPAAGDDSTNVATTGFVAGEIRTEASNRDAAIEDAISEEVTARNEAIEAAQQEAIDEAVAEALAQALPTDTASGAIASFPDGAEDVAVKSLIAQIEPIQNLNGQEYPWPPGGGINIFPNAVTKSQTSNGVTISTDGSGVYTLSGTATANTTIQFSLAEPIVVPPSSTHKILFKNSFANGNVSFIWLNGSTQVDSTGMTPANRVVDNYVALAGQTIDTVRIYVASGQTVNGTISPMVVLQSVASDSPFAPYSNICPIVTNAGKNKLPSKTLAELKALNTAGTWADNVYTYRGLSYTPEFGEDGRMTTFKVAAGTASGLSSFIISDSVDITGEYTVSGCPSGGANSSYRLRIGLASDDTSLAIDDGAGVSLSVTAPINLKFYVNNGITLTENKTVAPMIRDAANPDPTFVPYRCLARVNVEGKNLLPNDKTQYNTTIVNLGTTANDNGYHILLKAGTYTFSGAGSSVNWYMRKETDSANTSMSVPYTFTLTEDHLVRFWAFKSGSISPSDITWFQLELGSTATPYEPYKDRTYFSIAGEDIPSEVYGGKLNVTTGELTVESVRKSYDGTETATDIYSFVEAGRVNIDITNIPYYKQNFDTQTISNTYKTLGQVPSNSDFETLAQNEISAYDLSSAVSSKTIRLKDPRFTDLATARSLLAAEPLVVTLKLATPQTYHLDSIGQITTLLGDNNMWSNTGDISVKYRANTALYIEKKLGE